MEAISQALSQIASSPLELVAVGLALAYLLLAMYEIIWCWLCALISTIIYTSIFWKVNLLMDSALNVYYMIMAIYGWYQWTANGAGRQLEHQHQQQQQQMPIRRWSLHNHLFAAALILGATLVSGFLLAKNTQAAWPYLDSFTTWASVLTTYMVAKKILENWLYWIVIDSIAMVLYIERGLYPTALLFAAYLVIVVLGFFKWRSQYHQQSQDQHYEQNA